MQVRFQLRCHSVNYEKTHCNFYSLYKSSDTPKPKVKGKCYGELLVDEYFHYNVYCREIGMICGNCSSCHLSESLRALIQSKSAGIGLNCKSSQYSCKEPFTLSFQKISQQCFVSGVTIEGGKCDVKWKKMS